LSTGVYLTGLSRKLSRYRASTRFAWHRLPQQPVTAHRAGLKTLCGIGVYSDSPISAHHAVVEIAAAFPQGMCSRCNQAGLALGDPMFFVQVIACKYLKTIMRSNVPKSVSKALAKSSVFNAFCFNQIGALVELC